VESDVPTDIAIAVRCRRLGKGARSHEGGSAAVFVEDVVVVIALVLVVGGVDVDAFDVAAPVVAIAVAVAVAFGYWCIIDI